MTKLPSVLLCVLIASTSAIADQVDEAAIVLQFQRAADTYAFVHRQDERRSIPMALRVEGALFTPQAADLFRRRMRAAMARGCEPPHPSGRFEVPRVNMSMEGTMAAPACVIAQLPRLPEELAYRVSGAALLLVDAHLGVIVDVLHAAFP